MDRVLALLTRERDRQAIMTALPAETEVHFVMRPAELRPPWVGGPPIAVLVELPDPADNALGRALEALHRLAPTVPVWSYIPMERDAVREVVRLAARGLIVDVVIIEHDLRARLRLLLRDSRAWSETVSLWGVWQEWVGQEARAIVAACIDASISVATVNDVARQLNKSPRALERHVAHLGLPATHRVMSLCRLLRAMYRLDHPEASVKTVASELGYPSSHSLAQQLHRHTGLTISSLRASGGFVGLAAFVQAELSTTRGRALQRPHGAAHDGQRRELGPR